MGLRPTKSVIAKIIEAPKIIASPPDTGCWINTRRVGVKPGRPHHVNKETVFSIESFTVYHQQSLESLEVTILVGQVGQSLFHH